MDTQEAAKRLTKVIEQEGDARRGDLRNLLTGSTSPYAPQRGSEQPHEHIIHDVEARPLPSSIIDRYSAGTNVCRCGLLPSIGRAWASVDNVLFVWKPGGEDEIEIEYADEEHAIISLGVIEPRANIFFSSITHVLVVATPLEFILLGVCASGVSEKGGVPDAIEMQRLPGYSCPSDSVVARCIAEGPNGRIFIGGDDGKLHELMYRTPSAWFGKRLWKATHSSFIGKAIPSVLRFGKPDPIRQIKVDFDRHLLYILNDSGSITAFDLGEAGDQGPNKVAENGETSPRRATHISVVPPMESNQLTLMCICEDGKRVYYRAAAKFGSRNDRPTELKRLSTRLAPLNVSNSSRHVCVDSAVATDGVMAILDAVRNDNDSSLIVCQRDLRARGSETIQKAAGGGMQELVASTDAYGRAMGGAQAMALHAENVRRSRLQMANLRDAIIVNGELATQHMLPRKSIDAVTTANSMQIKLRRPVDHLIDALKGGLDATASLLSCYNGDESAAMLALVASGIVDAEEKERQVARSALLVADVPGAEVHTQNQQQPTTWRTQQGGNDSASMTVNSAVNFGQAVSTSSSSHFSSKHDGLYLVSARLIRGIFNRHVFQGGNKAKRSHLNQVKRTSVSQGIPTSALSMAKEQIASMTPLLRSILDLGPVPKESGIGNAKAKRKRSDDEYIHEHNSLQELQKILIRCGEAAGLLEEVYKLGVGAVLDEMPRDMVPRVSAALLKDIACPEKGNKGQRTSATHSAETNQIAPALVSAAMASARGRSEILAEALRQKAPMLFGEDDRTFFLAKQQLEKAANGVLDASLTLNEASSQANEALSSILAVKKESIRDVDQICCKFASLKRFDAIVRVALTAQDMSPVLALLSSIGESVSSGPSREGESQGRFPKLMSSLTSVTRKGSIQIATDLLSAIANPAPEPSFPYSSSANARGLHISQEDLNRICTILMRSNVLVNLMVEHLPKIGVERFLQGNDNDGLASLNAGRQISDESAHRLSILARMLQSSGEHLKAAKMLHALALRMPTESNGHVPTVTLETRRSLMDRALVAARSEVATGSLSNGNASSIRNVNAKGDRDPTPSAAELAESISFDCLLLERQVSIKNTLERTQGFQNAKSASEALKFNLVSLETLFHEYAFPFFLWDECIKLVASSRQSTEPLTDLWDGVLYASVRDSLLNLNTSAYVMSSEGANRNDAVPTSNYADRMETDAMHSDEAMIQACRKVEEIASSLPTSAPPSSMPSAHICWRLSQIGAGCWPAGECAPKCTSRGLRAATDILSRAFNGREEAIEAFVGSVTGEGNASAGVGLEPSRIDSTITCVTLATILCEGAGEEVSGRRARARIADSARRLLVDVVHPLVEAPEEVRGEVAGRLEAAKERLER